MPIYEYQCSRCNKVHEVMQRFSDTPMSVCPDCGGEVRKLISNTSFVLKGTGWYVTDYADSRKGKNGESAAKKAASTTAETKNGTESAKAAEEPKKQEPTPAS